MNIINSSNPLILLLLTAATVLLIFLGRELKKSYAPAIALGINLLLVIIHGVQLMTLASADFEQYQMILLRCIGVDCVLIFISFFAYLWIDDMECTIKKKKNLDDSLSWLWKDV